MRKWGTATGLSTAFLLVSGVALGQDRDPAAAQALFDAAQNLISQQRYEEACPKLRESQRLDPGIGTQFHLANCYEHTGKVASAWALFLEVASMARASGQDERDQAAMARARQLEPRLPKLTVSVPSDRRVEGLEVLRDGIIIGAIQWDAPMPVDPGAHEIVVRAPGRNTVKQSIELQEAMPLTFTMPALQFAGQPPAVRTEPAVAPPVKGEAPQASSTDDGGTSPWVWGLAGVGVVGVGVGTTFAVLAKRDYNDSRADCRSDNPNLCGTTGIELRNDARGKGDIATVAFGVGGAALLGAGLIWLLDGRSSDSARGTNDAGWRASGSVSPAGAALNLEGKF